MSIRLNVVLSQSADGPPQRRDLESEIVARLIGSAGIDLGLIGSLESLAENSTDRLMLERLGGDLALLSWETPAAAAERLAAARIAGRRAPHPLDPQPAAANGSDLAAVSDGEAGVRRIYHHPLGAHSPADLQTAIERLLAARRVVTFQLAPSPANSPSHSPANASARTLPLTSSRVTTAGSASAAPSAVPESTVAPERNFASESSSPRRSPSPADPPAAPDPWDALVDELNDSNI